MDLIELDSQPIFWPTLRGWGFAVVTQSRQTGIMKHALYDVACNFTDS